MKPVVAPIALFIALFSLSACSTISGPKPAVSPNTTPANVPAGSGVGSGVLGALGNGLLGASANRLDPASRKKALEAEYRALEYAPVGQVTNWKSGSGSGDVVAAQPYQVGSQNCRQYTHTFTIDGAPQTMRGTACRNPDGSWTPLT
ncbi:hypothetical protein [Phyllobacterium phragmitis]|uniref:hypothetical protein n=1 Tax=Phyllobacterium phragmitis TaxID=2670329 RepID=UPI0038B34A0B